MSINKFWIQLVKRDTKRGRAQWCNGAFKNYVRENSLCVESEVFDAKSRSKIGCLADPEIDSDAVNKLHLDHCFKTISEDMDIRINYSRLNCKKSKQEVLLRIQNLEITLQNWKKDNNIYIQTKFITLQKTIDDLRALFNENIFKTDKKIAADNAKIKQMINWEIKDVHSILKNNIIELYKLIKNEIKTVPKLG